MAELKDVMEEVAAVDEVGLIAMELVLRRSEFKISE